MNILFSVDQEKFMIETIEKVEKAQMVVIELTFLFG